MKEPFGLDGHVVAIGISVGLALREGEFVAEEMIREADRAMYDAKRRGKGRYQITVDSGLVP
jgi:GGDEF domain-containing protein